MSFKFDTTTTTSTSHKQTYEMLRKLKEYTLKAWDDSYKPKAGTEEAHAIETLREHPDAMALVEETEDASSAYSRASSLRIAKGKPSGTWEFSGRKVEGDDETETGAVYARFVSEDAPEEEGADEEE